MTSIFLKDFDHNYYNNYNNSLKYAANIILSSVTTILVNIKGEVLQPWNTLKKKLKFRFYWVKGKKQGKAAEVNLLSTFAKLLAGLMMVLHQ